MKNSDTRARIDAVAEAAVANDRFSVQRGGKSVDIKLDGLVVATADSLGNSYDGQRLTLAEQILGITVNNQ